MDKDGDGDLTRGEFLEFFIIKLKLCSAQQLEAINVRFDQIEQERTARERVLGMVDKVRRLTNPTTTHTLDSEVTAWGKTKLALETKTGHQMKGPDVLTVMSREISKNSAIGSNNGPAKKISVTRTESERRSSEKKNIYDTKIPLPSPQQPVTESNVFQFNGHHETTTKAPEDSETSNESGSSGSSGGKYAGQSGGGKSSRGGVVGNNTPANMYERSHPLSSMLAHIRKASELARVDVDNNIKKGNTVEAKASVKLLRSLVTLLHTSQKEFLPRLEADDPERRGIVH